MTFGRSVFEEYLRTGEDRGLRELGYDDCSGRGYPVDVRLSPELTKIMNQSTASIRPISTVNVTESSSFYILVDLSERAATWGTSNTAEVKVANIPIPLHELSIQPLTTNKALHDTAFNVEKWLASIIESKFNRDEAPVYITGDGIHQPRGILSHPKVPNSEYEWGSVGYVNARPEDTMFPEDALINLIYSLPSRFRANGTFVMNSKTSSHIRTMRDVDGRFLWSNGQSVIEPARLMGYPVLITNAMPDPVPDSFAIAFGDFRAGYTIVESPSMLILRDPFTARPNVIFHTIKKVGGDISNFAAIKLMKF